MDFVIDPLDRLDGIPEVVQDLSLPTKLAEQVIERGTFGDTLDEVLYGSADSYAQARLIYLQNRRFELGETPAATDESYYFDPYAEIAE